MQSFIKTGPFIACLALMAAWPAIHYARRADAISEKEARRLIAHAAGMNLKPEAVTVKKISSLGSAAVVVAQIETAFRLVKGEAGTWRVAEVSTGEGRWEDLDLIERALNQEKTARARAELQMVATALEAFRREHGFYVMADNSATLSDQLSPRYLGPVIRLDPWHRPYQYAGARDHYILRSAGADGQEGTADDIVING